MVPTILSNSGIHRPSVSVRHYVDLLDGLVLQGGIDVSPLSYGEEPLDPAWAGDRVRDLYELDLFWEFVNQGKPVLGVCRGAQLINVAMGGTLYQDLPTQRPQGLRHYCQERYDRHHHGIAFEAGGSLGELYAGCRGSLISSIHHQAVKDLGAGLRVEARAPEDGLIEAVRWEGAKFVLGVQWHPEFHDPSHPDYLDSSPIVREFLDQAAAARRESAEYKAQEHAHRIAPAS
jgi:gamma-glutamyl-gamma-aminobutyrate hydrolase PuuD